MRQNFSELFCRFKASETPDDWKDGWMDGGNINAEFRGSQKENEEAIKLVR